MRAIATRSQAMTNKAANASSRAFFLYLNRDWSADDGGALRVHVDRGLARDVVPAGGTLVAFLANEFEHEVMPSMRPRVIFIATGCPYSNAYNDRMRDMSAAYAKKGVLFVGINSNKTESVDDVVKHAKAHGHTFPILKDPSNKVADLYDASHTPEVYVVAKDGKLVYHGRIDDNSDDAAKVTSPDLKNALDALLAGQPVAKAETKAFGCSIKRV